MKSFKNSVGVTLLEVMLILVVAALIVIMSVRYYQSASSGQQANGILDEIQAITAVADGIARDSGSYAAVSSTVVKGLMPNQIMTSPWGSNITVTSGSPTTYVVTIPQTPAPVCVQTLPRLKSNNHYQNPACSSTATGDLTYTYDASY